MSNFQPSLIYENIFAFLRYRGATPKGQQLSGAEIQKVFAGDGPHTFEGSGSSGDIMVAVYLVGSKHLKAVKQLLASVAKIMAANRELLVVLGPGLAENVQNKCLAKCNDAINSRFGRAVRYTLFLANIPEIALVPAHRALSEEEALWLENHYLLDREKIGSYIIWQTDPACIWCGARPGQIVEIIRGSDAVGEGIDYRLCIPSKSSSSA